MRLVCDSSVNIKRPESVPHVTLETRRRQPQRASLCLQKLSKHGRSIEHLEILKFLSYRSQNMNNLLVLRRRLRRRRTRFLVVVSGDVLHFSDTEFINNFRLLQRRIVTFVIC
ncbi:hypothetical protein NL108_014758 [Boleophthalmus pectinirostris]|nr:hypothetical protein NL108_014758 [Boleophthalmus pectinirostris]